MINITFNACKARCRTLDHNFILSCFSRWWFMIPNPVAFSRVNAGIYRSSYPSKKYYKFIQSLRLKSLMYASNYIILYSDFPSYADAWIRRIYIQISGTSVFWMRSPYMKLTSAIIRNPSLQWMRRRFKRL